MGATRFSLLFRPVPVKLFVAIRDGSYTSQIIRNWIYVTPSSATEHMQHFKKFGLVTIKKKGRIRLIYFTPKGRQLKEILMRIVELCR